MKTTTALLAAFVALTGSATFGGATNWQSDLSALVVSSASNGKQRGHCQPIPLRVSIVSNSAPMRVSISDNTSGGSGDMIRASVWNAAVTAAMLRNKTMEGVRIDIDFEGDVDGPSAGGLMCLGILSALDGRKMPDDFAMTGTILPDGTVGLVGGVVQKLKGAAASGKIKRVAIPAFRRFEKDSNTGELVDLFRLGDKLGIKVHPVSHVDEAYRICHKLAKSAVDPVDERAVLRLDRYSENALIGEYRQLSDKLLGYLGGLATNEFAEIRSSASWHAIAPLPAVTCFEHGAILTAFDKIAENDAAMEAYWKAEQTMEDFVGKLIEGNQEAFEGCKNGDVDALTNLLARVYAFGDDLCESMLGWSESDDNDKDDESPFTGFEYSFGPVSDAASQLYSFDDAGIVEGLYLFDTLRRTTLEGAANAVKAPDSELSALDVLGEQITWVRNDIFDLLRLKSKKDEVYERIVKSMPECNLAENGGAVEKLFYNAWRSVRNQIDAQVVSDIESGFSATKDQALDLARASDVWFSRYLQQCHWAEIVQRIVRENKDSIREKGFTTGVDVFRQVETFVHASAMLLKYTDADFDLSTGRYDNTAFLTYAINNARECALASMAECRAAKLPYLSAIRDFEFAENARDDYGEDRIHGVLERYWMANMKAKALLMAFERPDAK